MVARLLVYGATGFTGRLIVDEALAFGLHPVLGGRSAQNLEPMSRSAGIESRQATLDDPGAVWRMLDGIDVLLNAAGPFSRTALPLARACIERGVHYLDVSGEIPSLESVSTLDQAARKRGVMLMPAVGFDVVPSDCMAAWAVRRLPTATELQIGLTGLDAISRGSAESVFEVSDGLVTIRRGGRLAKVPVGELESDFDFGRGPARATAIPWGDVVTAYHSTGVPDITVYYEATGIVRLGLGLLRGTGLLLQVPAVKSWLKSGARMLPDGPDDAYRARQRAAVVVIARDQAGRRAEVRLETPEVYSFTATTSVAIAERVLRRDLRAGFQTPARVYGADLVLSLPGVTRTVLA